LALYFNTPIKFKSISDKTFTIQASVPNVFKFIFNNTFDNYIYYFMRDKIYFTSDRVDVYIAYYDLTTKTTSICCTENMKDDINAYICDGASASVDWIICNQIL